MNTYEGKDIQDIKNSEHPLITYRNIPPENRTEAVAFEAVQRDPDCLKMTPVASLSERVLLQAIQSHPKLITYLPASLLSEPICGEAIRLEPIVFSQLPDEIKTPGLCEQMVDACVKKREFPWELLTAIPFPDSCMMAMERISAARIETIGFLFPQLRPSCMTQEVVDFAVQNDPYLLWRIPEKMIHEDICRMVVSEKGVFLRDIPDKYKTKELCMTALKSYPKNLKYFPDHLLSPEFLMNVIQENPANLQYVPSHHINRELCEEGIKSKDLQVGRAIPYPDLCVKLIESAPYQPGNENDKYLDIFSHMEITPPMAQAMLEKSPKEFVHFPDSLKSNEEVAITAIRLYPFNFHHIGDPLKTEAFCLNRIRENTEYAKHLPTRLKYSTFYSKMLEIDPYLIRFITPEERTRKLCKQVLDQTFGKDQREHNAIFGRIPYPDMIIEALKEIKEPDLAVNILFWTKKEIQTPEMVREAVKKDGHAIIYADEKNLTQDICHTAMRHRPFMFAWIPEQFRSAESSLLAVKLKEDAKKYVPASILKRENLYTFALKLEEKTGKAITADRLKEIYNGAAFLKSDPNRPVEGIKKPLVYWDQKQAGIKPFPSKNRHHL